MNNDIPNKKDGFDIFVRITAALMVLGIVMMLFIHIPNYYRARGGGNFSGCQLNMKEIATALETYYECNDRHYPSSLAMLVPEYKHSIPECPSAKMRTGGYAATYRVSRDLKIYTFYCSGLNHSIVGVRSNYPQYNSIEGLIAK